MQMSVRGRRAESSIVSCDVIKEERQVEEWSKVEVEAREANGLPGFRVFLFVSVLASRGCQNMTNRLHIMTSEG